MYKAVVWGLLLCTALLNITEAGSSAFVEDRGLIIYDRRNYFGEENDIISSVEEMLHYYGINASSMNQKEYKKGKIKEFSHLVFIGLENGIENEALLEEMETTDRKIFWVGKGIDRFLEKRHMEELTYLGQGTEAVGIRYKEDRYRLDRMENFQRLKIETSHGIKTAMIEDGGYDEPLLIQYEDLMIQTAVRGDGILFYILGDALLAFFNRDFAENQWKIYSQFASKKITKEYIEKKSGMIPQVNRIYITSNVGTKILAIFIGAVCGVFLLLFLFLRRKGRRNLF